MRKNVRSEVTIATRSRNGAISLKRLLYLGKANLTPEEFVSEAPRRALNFFGSLELP